MGKRRFSILVSLFLIGAAFFWGVEQGQAAGPVLTPGVDYTLSNFAYSPTTIKKFVDSLPGVNAANNLSQQIPLATPDTTTFGAGTDYYEIALVEYRERMHTNLPPVVGTWPAAQTGGTRLRGYVQEVNGVAVTVPHYLGPLILAAKNRPVRIKFTNRLPAGAGGNLFLPVDGTMMGAGMGPLTAGGAACDPTVSACASYTQNRATLHLHGGLPPWISDGTAHQWLTPAGEVGLTPFLRGASQNNVPDMWYNSATGNVIASCAGHLTCATGGATTTPPGVGTFYWTNQQGGRLMFYHDHAVGMTSVDVYAGEAAGYLLVDPLEDTSLAALGVPGTIPNAPSLVGNDLAHLIPLVIQDKSFVPSTVLTTDPHWDTVNWGGTGDLWFPHVYMPNQDPTALSGANPLGRWDYGPWFWPIFPAGIPPLVSHVPEAFMDTPVVNGTAYPHVDVQPTKYRLRILNAANDRMFDLQLYVADPAGHAIDATGADVAPGTGFGTEVKMVPAAPTTVCVSPTIPNNPVGCFPATWAAQTPGMTPDILDSRPSGVPDPAFRGPAMIQIGTEGGILPKPALLLNSPVGFEQNKKNIVVLNVLEKTLMLAPAERADVIVDFTNFGGKTIILYNDSPAPVPAADPRNDFYTGDLDYSAAGLNNQGGAPSTVAGFGPNTRTIMQFRVAAGGAATAPVDDYNPTLLSNLQNATTGLPHLFALYQDPPIVPQAAYGLPSGPYNVTYTDTIGANIARISDLSLTFAPFGSTTPATVAMANKTIQELFDPLGRMNATLGVELPKTTSTIQTTVPLGFIDPPTDILRANGTQLWKITHNGVDTHGVHFHLVNVQVVNRVGWDGAVRDTDPNELGWKDTVRMNPLEDIIVAMRAKVPTFPFPIHNSVRPLNPAMPVGSTFASIDPLTGTPNTVVNAITNFGNEYTWHCHILGHEENDMMRPLVLNVDQLLYVSNPGTGIWQWDMGTWTQINTVNPTSMAASGATLYADFAGLGLYAWNGTTWTQINPGHPASMAAAGSMLYADFTANGLYAWNGTTWTQINTVHPASMVAAGSTLYVDFAAYGLYAWNGSTWTQINTVHPARMAAAGSMLYADFTAYGLYAWNGSTWAQINTVHPASMSAAGSMLYADFTAYGYYAWNGSTWTEINPVHPASMSASGSVLYADFAGLGIYKWELGAWSQLNPTEPTIMVAGF